jgi:hypothetical protein
MEEKKSKHEKVNDSKKEEMAKKLMKFGTGPGCEYYGRQKWPEQRKHTGRHG